MKINNLRLAALLLIFLPSALFISCKKGENDPAISFRSRKARIVGDWKLDKGTNKYTSESFNVTTTFNGTSGTEVTNSITRNFTYIYELSFRKDGTFSYHSSQTFEGATPEIYKFEGQWSFARKNKAGNLKNKESILLTYISGTYTSDGVTSSGSQSKPTDGELYIIDQLDHELMVIKSVSTTSYASNTNVSESKTESELTFVPR